jgi:arylsulfatase A-like enzyme
MFLVLRQMRWVIAVLVVLNTGGCSKKSPQPAEASRPTDIILVTLDTTRRDHLGAYGYDRPVSVNLDRFAEGADLYTRAYASSSWTVPTHASILTGLYASDHGAHAETAGDAFVQLRADVPTLAEQLRSRGYATAAILGAHTLAERFGLARGFDHYEAPTAQSLLASRRADQITRRALSWLDEQADDPVFLFVNYFDPHIPYRPPAGCHERFAPGVAHHAGISVDWLKRPMNENLQLYDAEICFMDEQFGVLIEGLKERHRLNDALVVVVADHGESFDLVEGMKHGHTLDEELIRVPLFVKQPRQRRGTRIEDVFETRRLFHTMLTAAKASPPEAAQAQDDSQEFAVSELWRGTPEQSNPVLRALVRWPLKLVVPPGDGSSDSRLYDLAASASEAADLAKKKSQERAALEALLGAWLADRKAVTGQPVELDPDMVEKLRALGYLE